MPLSGLESQHSTNKNNDNDNEDEKDNKNMNMMFNMLLLLYCIVMYKQGTANYKR